MTVSYARDELSLIAKARHRWRHRLDEERAVCGSGRNIRTILVDTNLTMSRRRSRDYLAIAMILVMVRISSQQFEATFAASLLPLE
jgi:hypothetical protein